MSKYLNLRDELEKTGAGKMKCYGYSMLPILKSGSVCTYKQEKEYEVGDIVFCKVNGRFIDAHKVIKKDKTRGYLIANNAGFENGWTKLVYGRVVKAEMGTHVKTVKEFIR